MKKPWDSFEKNYVAVETLDADSGKTRLRYEYYGPWFVHRGTVAALLKEKWIIGAALAINLLSVIGSGLVDSVLNRVGVTCIPYGLALAALVFTAMGSVLFLVSGRKVKRPEYERMDRILRSAPIIEALLLLCAFLAAIVLALTGKVTGSGLVPMAGYLTGSGCSFLTWYLFRTLQYRKEKNTEFEYAEENTPGFSPEEES